ncbi:hypothetical protein JCM10212_006289 [Sporobolomyces blumeae]
MSRPSTSAAATPAWLSETLAAPIAPASHDDTMTERRPPSSLVGQLVDAAVEEDFVEVIKLVNDLKELEGGVEAMNEAHSILDITALIAIGRAPEATDERIAMLDHLLSSGVRPPDTWSLEYDALAPWARDKVIDFDQGTTGMIDEERPATYEQVFEQLAVDFPALTNDGPLSPPDDSLMTFSPDAADGDPLSPSGMNPFDHSPFVSSPFEPLNLRALLDTPAIPAPAYAENLSIDVDSTVGIAPDDARQLSMPSSIDEIGGDSHPSVKASSRPAQAEDASSSSSESPDPASSPVRPGSASSMSSSSSGLSPIKQPPIRKSARPKKVPPSLFIPSPKRQKIASPRAIANLLSPTPDPTEASGTPRSTSAIEVLDLTIDSDDDDDECVKETIRKFESIKIGSKRRRGNETSIAAPTTPPPVGTVTLDSSSAPRRFAPLPDRSRQPPIDTAAEFDKRLYVAALPQTFSRVDLVRMFADALRVQVEVRMLKAEEGHAWAIVEFVDSVTRDYVFENFRMRLAHGYQVRLAPVNEREHVWKHVLEIRNLPDSWDYLTAHEFLFTKLGRNFASFSLRRPSGGAPSSSIAPATTPNRWQQRNLVVRVEVRYATELDNAVKKLRGESVYRMPIEVAVVKSSRGGEGPGFSSPLARSQTSTSSTSRAVARPAPDPRSVPSKTLPLAPLALDKPNAVSSTSASSGKKKKKNKIDFSSILGFDCSSC